MPDKVNILGVKFDHTTKQEMVNQLHDNIKMNKKTFVVTANPEIVMEATMNATFKDTLRDADHIIADGIGVILGAKILKKPLPERIPGIELMEELLQIANQESLNVFFLGSREEVIKKTVRNVKKDYPNLIIGGYHHGFFKENDSQILDMVKRANSDLIFVALGFPKQEYWIQNHIDSFYKGIFMGVGGSFDVLAGTVKRAPAIWRKLNLEWLHRLLQQPSRWKRMIVLPIFVKKVWQSKQKS
ncbi:WecB/TagA/CpsF family glycosyltransferase [Lederbergia citrea]|uniref:N-acetylglucosaminyldiphosphoundecaprenol N-acetyl-beta-D-mannosaminyltransferase n=1 Tax=Lederbergia citrea TaxID=2833581 RepID=A0A942Z5I6_9BACI|nr:WecB/TagA/CpsF family glycosyltransferase [Lederbergia citrea]MBS4223392.1 WecB/TagA/CpsF family glycosyltransferase [Lederbergia citrea]